MPLIPVNEIAAMLAERIDVLAAELLPHGKRTGAEWRVGSLHGEAGGSLGVHLRGAKAGVWCDFAGRGRGDALDLVAAVRCGGDKRQAIAWAMSWLGLTTQDRASLETRRAETQRAVAQRQAQADAEAREKSATAQRLWLHAEAALRGTPVATYLRTRGIDLGELRRQPRALRYHPALVHAGSDRRWPAMLAAITGPDGATIGVHRTYLSPSGAGKAPVEPVKMVLGRVSGGCIRLWRGASGRPWAEMPDGEDVHLTEGIEDALSVVMALPEARVAAAISLGNLADVALPPACAQVTLWTQRDTSNAALLAADRAVSAHLAAGRRVRVVRMPANVKDVNDLLRQGQEAVA